MNNWIKFVIFTLILTLFGLHGCTDNPAGSPVVPENSPEIQKSVSDANQPHMCGGLFLLNINTIDETVKVVPLRSGDWHFNVTGILNTTMGVTAVPVPSESDPPNGLFVMDVSLTHPFATKPQFTGFDVKGVLMTPGSVIVGDLTFAGLDDIQLENADGYTRWWNPNEFTTPGMLGYVEGNLAIGNPLNLTAHVNPYKYFADILDYNDNVSSAANENIFNPQGRGVFTAGYSNTRRYKIRFPMDPGPQVLFGYAVDVSWALPDPNPPVDIPLDFPFEANQPEVFLVSHKIPVNTLYYDSIAAVGGGDLALDIVCTDWQGMAAGNIADQIYSVNVIVPGLMQFWVPADFRTDSGSSASYSVDLSRFLTPTEPGPVQVIIKVRSTDGSTYIQTGAAAPDETLAAWQIINIDVLDAICEDDDNDYFPDAISINYGQTRTGQVCSPDDEFDYYTFDVDLYNQPYGELRLSCDDSSTVLEISDENYLMLEYTSVVDGTAVLDLNELDLLPGTYYIRIGSCGLSQVAVYALTLDAEQVNSIPVPTDVTPNQLFCKPSKLYRSHSHVFMTGEYGLWIYSMSDPSNPEFVRFDHIDVGDDAEMWNYRLWNIVPQDDGYSDINMIDLTDNVNPVMHNELLNLLSPLGDLTLDSQHLYVGRPNLPGVGATVYDIHTDMLNPTEVTTINFAAQTEFLDIIRPTQSSRSLLTATDNQIYSWDIDDVGAITNNGLYNFSGGGGFTDIDTNNYNIFLTTYDSGGPQGSFYILEKLMGSGFNELGSVTVPGNSNSMTRWSPYAYVGDGNAGFTIIDVDEYATPLVDSTTPTSSPCGDVIANGDIICASLEDAGMAVIDAGNSENPSVIGELDLLNSPWVAALDGDTLYAADRSGWNRDIVAVDVSDPLNASIIDKFPWGDYYRCMDAQDGLVAVADTHNCLLLDASAPSNLTQYSTISMTIGQDVLRLYGDVLYTGGTAWQVKIWDISNPSAPVPQSPVSTGGGVHEIKIIRNYMYVATDEGVSIFNVLYTPLEPDFVTTYTTSSPALDIDVQGRYLYVLQNDRLLVVGIDNPSVPHYIGGTNVGSINTLDTLAVEGQHAYVQAPNSAVHILDVWPPESPGYHNAVYSEWFAGAPNYPHELIVEDGILYGLNMYTGMRIYDLY